MKKIICFLWCCLALNAVYAQGWERIFPLGDFNTFRRGDLIPTPDGGFLLNSSFGHVPPPFDSSTVQYHLRKLAANGDVQWYETHDELFGATVVAMWPAESNRLLFITLSGDTTRLVKTDASFQPLWSRVMDAPEHGGIKTSVKTVAGGYVFAYQKNDEQFEPVRVIKTDLDGNVIWQHDFTFVNNFTWREFVSDKQGNLFFFGEGGNPFGAVVGKVSAAGDYLFSKYHPDAPTGFSPVLLNDNSLAFLDFANHLHLLDGNGELVNTLNLTGYIYRMAATADGNLLAALQGTQSMLQKITPDGTVLWSRTFDNANAAYDKAPFAVRPLADGGCAVLFVASNIEQPFYVVRTDANGLIYTNRLHGNIFADLDGDCLNDPGTDLPAPQVTIVAQDGNALYYAVTDSAGNYDFTLDTGNYLLRISPYGLWEPCEDSIFATFGAYDTLEWNVGLTSEIDCPWPTVSLDAPFLRRCFPSVYSIAYANLGGVTADSATVTVSFDPGLTLNSASQPYENLGNNTYRFYIGELAPLERGVIQATVAVSCNAELGQTHCSSASIAIANPCPAAGIEMPVIEVLAACTGDSVEFSIRNVGGAPMLLPAEFVIIEDLIIMRDGQFQLQAQEETTVKCPANGSTSRIYAGHAPGEPPFFAPTAAVEGCNGPLQAGFWNMFPEHIVNQTFDRDCQPNIGSYDPNDKQAVPTGYGAEHYIGRGVALDYKIRFQNTGTDTAFTVVVRDTLSAWLDASRVQPGAASHPYTWQLLGNGVLQFRFDNILLPDSNVNEAASHGYITFRIDQQPDLPLETLIENKAAIYFDFNEPVITNTTFHRVGQAFIFVGAWEPALPAAEVEVAPNPFGAETRISVKRLESHTPLTLRIVDVQGKTVREARSETPFFTISRGDLQPGIYLFGIYQEGQPVGRGKLMVRE